MRSELTPRFVSSAVLERRADRARRFALLTIVVRIVDPTHQPPRSYSAPFSFVSLQSALRHSKLVRRAFDDPFGSIDDRRGPAAHRYTWGRSTGLLYTHPARSLNPSPNRTATIGARQLGHYGGHAYHAVQVSIVCEGCWFVGLSV